MQIYADGITVEIERELTHKEFLAIYAGECGAGVIPAKYYLDQQGYVEGSYREHGHGAGYGTGKFKIKAFAITVPDVGHETL